MNPTSLENLCQHLSTGTSTTLTALLPNEIQQEAGHFNVFDLGSLAQPVRPKPMAPFPCRAYYKISMFSGRSRAEYLDKIIDMEQHTLVFSTPKIPFYWLTSCEIARSALTPFARVKRRPTLRVIKARVLLRRLANGLLIMP